MKFEVLPIVMMTSYQGDNIHANAVAVGCDEFLPKPIDFDRLDASLDYFVPSKITATPPNSGRSI
jgi:CheY-like chemotaxis protein